MIKVIHVNICLEDMYRD